MVKFCSKCGTKRRATANFCRNCGHSFQQHIMPALSSQTQLSSFEPIRKFSALMTNQQEWLRKNTLLAPLQELVDNISLRTALEEATRLHKEQVLTGYQAYTIEHIEFVIDQIRNARREAGAEIDLEIKQRDLDIEDVIAEREHKRRLERLRIEHQHQEKMMELRAQLELINALIQSFNRLQLVRLEAEAHGLAGVEQMKLLTQIIQQSFSALAEIDAGQIKWAQRIEDLDFENLEDAHSYQLLDELVQAITDRLTKGIIEFAEPKRNQETRRSS